MDSNQLMAARSFLSPFLESRNKIPCLPSSSIFLHNISNFYFKFLLSQSRSLLLLLIRILIPFRSTFAKNKQKQILQFVVVLIFFFSPSSSDDPRRRRLRSFSLSLKSTAEGSLCAFTKGQSGLASSCCCLS